MLNRIKWDKESIQKEALRYNSRIEFQKKSPAYKAAYRRGILDEICSHMKLLWENKWTFEKLQQEALKYLTKGEFQKYSSSAYQISCRQKILDQICFHMNVKKKVWTIEKLQEEASKYNSRIEFQNANASAYQAARRKNLLDRICSHMDCELIYWDFESIKQEALKYKSRSEFQKNNPKCYQAAQRRKILDSVCSHMLNKLTYWTNEMLCLEALKYETRVQFQKNSGSAYNISLRKGNRFLDEICYHMKGLGGSSSMEKELFNLIKSSYSKTQTLIDTKIKILNKEYIKRLDIDIYVPELRKGIEFDGKYHHSIDGLRRGHPTWANDDILNYHEIKDSWFLSKGIQVLHIKEEDWKKDKQECIEKCLSFLRGENVEQVA